MRLYHHQIYMRRRLLMSLLSACSVLSPGLIVHVSVLSEDQLMHHIFLVIEEATLFTIF